MAKVARAAVTASMASVFPRPLTARSRCLDDSTADLGEGLSKHGPVGPGAFRSDQHTVELTLGSPSDPARARLIPAAVVGNVCSSINVPAASRTA